MSGTVEVGEGRSENEGGALTNAHAGRSDTAATSSQGTEPKAAGSKKTRARK
jgi:hypothetical protein